ncbi:S41 family peptidase [Candidatus Microgenomates bacterium]|nr:S41 family peptidase [Candidatus Microgenomates bacterium]
MITKEGDRNKKILLTGILLVVVFVAGLITGRNVNTDALSFLTLKRASEGVNMNRFWSVWDLVAGNYVDSDKVDINKMVDGAIKGMVNSFDDPATVYLNKEETEEFDAASEGKYFEGIGAELGYDNGQIIVVTPIEGSPAKEAGLRPGDYILKVDGYELTSSDTVYDAVAKIRGESGTEVVLTILHKGDSATQDIKITRKEITVPSMTLEFVGEKKDIAYFKVSRFTDTSYNTWVALWDSKVTEIKKAGVKKIILDLRGNPGGFFDAAIYAADDFLDEGFVISQQRDSEGEVVKYDSKKGGDLTDAKVVVLINSGSASASEILSGALKQSKRATIIGEKTYGKGTAQKIFTLSDGSSLHLTILKWLLPDGTNIDKSNSITPDIEVPLTSDDFKNGVDPQYSKALEEVSK